MCGTSVDCHFWATEFSSESGGQGTVSPVRAAQPYRDLKWKQKSQSDHVLHPCTLHEETCHSGLQTKAATVTSSEAYAFTHWPSLYVIAPSSQVDHEAQRLRSRPASLGRDTSPVVGTPGDMHA